MPKANRKQNNSAKPRRTARTANFSNNKKVGPSQMSALNAKTQRVTGRELLATVTKRQDGPAYSFNPIQQFSNDARSFEDMRMFHLFEMYERWFVRSLKLEWIPSVPVTTPGTIHCAPEYDPSDLFAPLDNESAISELSRMMGYASGPISEGLIVNMVNYRLPSGRWMFDDLYTSPKSDERFTNFGKFLSVVDVDLNFNGTVGRWMMSYDIEFSIPQLSKVEEVPNIYQDLNINAGTILDSIIRPSLTTSLSLGEAWKLTTPEGLTQLTMQAGSIIRGIYKADPSQDQPPKILDGDKEVPDGTPVYIKPAVYNTDENASMSFAQKIGDMAFDRDFSRPATLKTGSIFGPAAYALLGLATVIKGRLQPL